ncbi:MAG: T9SS type A sorting domain-containing protein [Bacteroidetes bacterium]|nr:T9SS type A sorting domain-containing protein [Bacteroidota bacterium]
MYKVRLLIVLLFIQTWIIYKGNAQPLSATSSTGSASTTSITFSTVTGASVNVDVTSINYLLLVSTFELEMTSAGNDNRQASIRIADNADPDNINSGVFVRGLSASKSTDFGIGSIVYIFDVSAFSGNRTYNLEHSFSTSARTLSTSGTIVAVSLTDGTTDLYNSVKQLVSPVTMTDTWAGITGMETDVITTTAVGGFYVAASIESLTTSFKTASVAEWKLQYKKGVGGTWTDLSNTVGRSMFNTVDKGLISLVGFLPDATTTGDYYFRISHMRTSATSTIQTTQANIVAVALATSEGKYPVFSKKATGVTTTSGTLVDATTASITPDINTDVFIHAQYGMRGSAEINSSIYDLFVDNSIFNGSDQQRYISSSSDIGSGASVGLAQGVSSGTTYAVSLRHASDGTSTITTNDISLTGFGLNINSGPLPIELLTFEVGTEESGVYLIWQTASENNNDFFTVERSVNGIEWEEIQKKQGAGKSNMILTYTAFDDNPYQGLSYYRLKQTDFDSQYSLSKIKTVFFDKSTNEQIKIFPNPSKNRVTISASEEELEHILIFNSLGQNVTDFIKIITKERKALIIDLSNLPNGCYILKTKTTSSIFYK